MIKPIISSSSSADQGSLAFGSESSKKPSVFPKNLQKMLDSSRQAIDSLKNVPSNFQEEIKSFCFVEGDSAPGPASAPFLFIDHTKFRSLNLNKEKTYLSEHLILKSGRAKTKSQQKVHFKSINPSKSNPSNLVIGFNPNSSLSFLENGDLLKTDPSYPLPHTYFPKLIEELESNLLKKEVLLGKLIEFEVGMDFTLGEFSNFHTGRGGLLSAFTSSLDIMLDDLPSTFQLKNIFTQSDILGYNEKFKGFHGVTSLKEFLGSDFLFSYNPQSNVCSIRIASEARGHSFIDIKIYDKSKESVHWDCDDSTRIRFEVVFKGDSVKLFSKNNVPDMERITAFLNNYFELTFLLLSKSDKPLQEDLHLVRNLLSTFSHASSLSLGEEGEGREGREGREGKEWKVLIEKEEEVVNQNSSLLEKEKEKNGIEEEREIEKNKKM